MREDPGTGTVDWELDTDGRPERPTGHNLEHQLSGPRIANH